MDTEAMKDDDRKPTAIGEESTGIDRAIITKRKQAEEALRKSEEKLSKAFQATSDAVSITRLSDGIFLYVNPALAKMAKRPIEELMGQTALDLNLWVNPEERMELVKRIKAEGEVNNFEIELRSADGEIRPNSMSARVIEIQGEECMVSVTRDITELKQTEKALFESENKYKTLFEQSADAILIIEGDTFVDCNLATIKMLGYKNKEEFLGTHPSELSPEFQPGGRNSFDKANEILPTVFDKGSIRFEWEHKRKNGDVFPVEVLLTAVSVGERKFIHCVWRDITERKEMEYLVIASEERFRDMVNLLPQTIYETDKRGNLTFTNRTGLDTFGTMADDIESGTHVRDFLIPEERKRGVGNLRKTLRREMTGPNEYTMLRKDGSTFPAIVHSSPIIKEGEVIGIRGLVIDITKRKHAEKGITRFSRIFEDSLNEIYLFDVDSLKFVQVNNAAQRNLGYTMEELQELTAIDLKPEFTSELFAELIAPLRKGEKKKIVFETVHKRKDKSLYNVEVHLQLLKYEHETLFVAIILDITGHKQAVEKLKESEEKYRLLADHVADIVWTRDMNMKLTYISPSVEKISGFSVEEKMTQTLKQSMTSSSVETVKQILEEEFAREREGTAEPGRAVTFHLDMYRKDGSIYPVESTVSFVRNDKGEAIGIVGINRDITERKQVEEERLQLEQQLLQAQKMEVVGQLTGGIAHDFNNILAIIQGNLELLGARLKDDVKGTHHLEKSLFNVKRAAQLTQRLLAFSRKQILQPSPLDLNDLIRGVHELLQRTLGEAIEVETVCAGGLWRSFADVSQVENCLLNLTINARDAMPGGGKLTIETANVRLDDNYAATHAEVVAGQYVMLAVTDTGTGIPDEVLEHIFEPFYTTKGVGKGSGLGMSMAYGFARQSGGHIAIYSEVGEGTTIKLYLPRYTGSNEDEVKKGAITADIPTGQQETVLVVEDEPDLLEIVVAQLESLGYAVISAKDGAMVPVIIENNEGVDLLLTDVVLSGDMNGSDIAKALQKQHPAIKVLYMSGYTENAVVHQGRLEGDIQLLRKPFTRDELARKIRERLDS